MKLCVKTILHLIQLLGRDAKVQAKSRRRAWSVWTSDDDMPLDLELGARSEGQLSCKEEEGLQNKDRDLT